MKKEKIKRKLVNLFIVLNVLIFSKKDLNNKLKKDSAVFITTSKNQIYLAIISAISLHNNINDIKIFFINDGTLSKFHKKIIKMLGTNFAIINNPKKSFLKTINKFSLIKEMYHQSWTGKKFLIPILSGYKKTIILDSDCIFFSNPEEIKKWLNNKSTKISLFLQDYMNFTSISSVEAMYYLGVKIKNKKINSGLLCFNNEEFFKNCSIKEINSFIKGIGKAMSERITRDYYGDIDLKHQMHLIEQTMYWLCLSKIKTKAFNKDYSLLKTKNKSPVFLHFTPDAANKEIEYNYLLSSIFESIKKPTKIKYWYRSFPIEKFLNILNEKGFRKNEIYFLSSYKVLKT